MHFLYDMITQIKQIPSKNYTISSHENLGQLCTGEGDFNSWPAIDLFPIKAEVEEEAGVVVHFPSNERWRQEGMLVSISEEILTLTHHYFFKYIYFFPCTSARIHLCFALSLSLSSCVSIVFVFAMND